MRGAAPSSHRRGGGTVLSSARQWRRRSTAAAAFDGGGDDNDVWSERARRARPGRRSLCRLEWDLLSRKSPRAARRTRSARRPSASATKMDVGTDTQWRQLRMLHNQWCFPLTSDGPCSTNLGRAHVQDLPTVSSVRARRCHMLCHRHAECSFARMRRRFSFCAHIHLARKLAYKRRCGVVGYSSKAMIRSNSGSTWVYFASPQTREIFSGTKSVLWRMCTTEDDARTNCMFCNRYVW